MPYIEPNIAKPLWKLGLGWVITLCGMSFCKYAFMCDELDRILPKGPYLPCLRMAGRAWQVGPFWQDTIELFQYIGTGHCQ